MMSTAQINLFASRCDFGHRAALSPLAPSRTQANESDRFFLSEVKPLLNSRCISCHGPDKAEGGLRLDTREAALKGGDSGPAVVPGKPDQSLLLMAVKRTHKVLEMPPKEKLSGKDIAILERWIKDGAPWPSPRRQRHSCRLLPRANTSATHGPIRAIRSCNSSVASVSTCGRSSQ